MSKKITKIIAGGCSISSSENDLFTTILGSCVCVCIRDPEIRLGGMNHFSLPGDEKNFTNNKVNLTLGTRYGVFAMEKLINLILQAGGKKKRFEIKIFGGADVTTNSNKIGQINSNFIKKFLDREGLKIVSEDLGGSFGRSVEYYPYSGKVMVRLLKRPEELSLIDEDKIHTIFKNTQNIEGYIHLY